MAQRDSLPKNYPSPHSLSSTAPTRSALLGGVSDTNPREAQRAAIA